MSKFKPIIWLEDCFYQNNKNLESCATNFLINEFQYQVIDEDINGNILLS